MVDRTSRQHRSWNMSRIRGSNTKPEKAVRSLLHHMGYRFRLHRRNLPGTPDLILPKYQTVIFVHGCFWHRHKNCQYAYTPKSRINFWDAKFKENMTRDRCVQRQLRKEGWRIITVWECQIKNSDRLAKRLGRLLHHQ